MPAKRRRQSTTKPPHVTTSVEIFLEMVQAVSSGVQMVPRSAGDKEYFAQDWFADRLKALNLAFKPQGRNRYPDFIVDGKVREGFEVKSLRFANSKPARKNIDFNSTIPSGRKDGMDTFLVFFLYTGTGSSNRGVHTISLAHADLINSDHGVADEHINVAVHQFGSFGNGFIRNRKMYVFPHQISLDASGLGRIRLIVPSTWGLVNPGLKRVGTLSRQVCSEAVDSYTIKLHGKGDAVIHRVPYANAKEIKEFEVFEAV